MNHVHPRLRRHPALDARAAGHRAPAAQATQRDPPLPALVDSFHVSFESQLLTAKDPNGRQTKFAFTGGGESLRVLADAIHNAIQRLDGRAR